MAENSILYPLDKDAVKGNSLGITIKSVVTARKEQEAVILTNRNLTLLLAEWFINKFGRNLHDYEARIPLQIMPEDSDQHFFPERLEFEKQCSEPIYVLTKDGFMSIRWCYCMNSWERELRKCTPNPSEKFITGKLQNRFSELLNRVLLGIIGMDWAVEIIDKDTWKLFDLIFEEECNYFK